MTYLKFLYTVTNIHANIYVQGETHRIITLFLRHKQGQESNESYSYI